MADPNIYNKPYQQDGKTLYYSGLASNFPGTGGSALSSSQKPIDIGAISSSSNIAVPPTPPPTLPDYSKIAVSTPAIANTPKQDVLDTERADLTADIVADSTKLGTKSARKAELEGEQNLPALNQQLNELNNQIRTVQSEAFGATQKSENRLAPTFAITGEQAAIERQRAVRVYGIAAAAEAIQGNIALAEDHVTRALAAEFDPLEKEIETYPSGWGRLAQVSEGREVIGLILEVVL